MAIHCSWFLMSIAHLHPGNLNQIFNQEPSLNTHLLRVLIPQTVTGLHLSELCYRRNPKLPRILLWLKLL
uniref:Uncharacterized protein n=1 Tax=Tetranychus urticae TaxID=32264 RepID=T1L0K6_TETUR